MKLYVLIRRNVATRHRMGYKSLCCQYKFNVDGSEHGVSAPAEFGKIWIGKDHGSFALGFWDTI